MTGLYGKDTGTGWLIDYPDDHILDVDDVYLLPDELQAEGYETAAFGKWHLGVEEDGDDEAPFDAGFDYFEGTFIRWNKYQGAGPWDPYLDYKWTTVDSAGASTERICRDEPVGETCDQEISTAYLTVDTVDSAIDWIQNTASEPWFVYLALLAPHRPWSCPPDDVYIGSEYSGCVSAPDKLDKYYGMLNVVDEQIDRLLDTTEVNIGTSGDTYVFLLSDNGSPDNEDLARTPVDEDEVKGTVFEGGVRVPFFVAGPTVEDGEVLDDLFINVSDLYATVLDLAGVSTNPRPNDWERNQSQSFLDYIESATPTRIRDCVYTEVFEPNGDISTTTINIYNRATAGVTATGEDDVFKYVQQLGGAQVGLFNLSDDPWEDDNLCATTGCSETEDQIISELMECRDDFSAECTLAALGEDCDFDSDCCPGLFCESQSGACAISI